MGMFAALMLIAAGGDAAQPTAPAALPSFVAQQLKAVRYKWALADLNGDGRAEALVYVTDADRCGSGGCDLFVLTPIGSTYRIVTGLSVTRPPVRVLPTRSHGWHDLGVFVAGGGILPGRDVQLRFDGRSYPENPTVVPSQPLARPRGNVLIAP